MLFVAHRGESLEAPENTLAAFRLAWQRRCRCIECDVRRTSDGEIVCMHDPSTLRTTGVDYVVERTPYSKLWRLDAGSWKDPEWIGEAIPLLSEVLYEMPADGRIFIELKSSSDILEPLFEVIDKAQVSFWQIRLIAFDFETIKRAQALFPAVKVHLLTSFEEQNGQLVPDAETLLEKLQVAGVAGIGFQANDSLNKDFVRTFTEAGIDVNVWTIDDLDKARRFAQMGVNSITSNHAAYLAGNMI